MPSTPSNERDELARCGCKPGTSENGWHEERSEKCQQAERDAFTRAIEAFNTWRENQ